MVRWGLLFQGQFSDAQWVRHLLNGFEGSQHWGPPGTHGKLGRLSREGLACVFSRELSCDVLQTGNTQIAQC